MAIDFPNINHVAFYIGTLEVRWYSLAYIFGILFGWYGFTKVQKFSLSKTAIDSLISYVVLGIVIGGRCGMLFYEPKLYLIDHPTLIFQIWKGGMSFHGGLIGVVIALWMFAKKHKIPFLELLDLAACFAPIGIFFGRMANFVNGELWGKPTNLSWAMVFPLADNLPRHPSQIYEAATEGFLLFAIMQFLLLKTKARSYPGFMSGVMMTVYAVSRISIEFVREPDLIFCYSSLCITMGQILCIPMLCAAAILFNRCKKQI